MNELGRDLLAERGAPFTLSENDFIFMMHQGYQFWWFDRSLGKGSPVYYYLEGDPEPRIAFPNFKTFVADLSRKPQQDVG